MKVLAIETSCDETAAAVVQKHNGKINILSNVVASSEKVHVKTGGIVPEVASREQVKSIIPVVDKAIQDSRFKIQDLDVVAVTVGPGLIGSLLVGVETAKALSYAWDKPVLPVNHLTAHLLVNFIDKKIKLPAVGMVVSGGHTDIVLVTHAASSRNHMRWIGGTRDDAAGECFDKCAKLLGLPYPGGPEISREADRLLKRPVPVDKQQRPAWKAPRPLLYSDTLDLSFSGLKTAVLRKVQSNRFSKPELAYEIQEAIVEVLVSKLRRAADKYSPKSILLGGGVVANKRLRDELQRKFGKYDLHVPDLKYCTDNAGMVGVAGILNGSPTSWDKLKVDPGLEIGDGI